MLMEYEDDEINAPLINKKKSKGSKANQGGKKGDFSSLLRHKDSVEYVKSKQKKRAES